MSAQLPESLEIFELEEIGSDKINHAHCGACYPMDPGRIVITLCGELSRCNGTTVGATGCEKCDDIIECPVCGADLSY